MDCVIPRSHAGNNVCLFNWHFVMNKHVSQLAQLMQLPCTCTTAYFLVWMHFGHLRSWTEHNGDSLQFKKCCNYLLLSTAQPTWGVAAKTSKRSVPTAQIKLALPINLQTLDQELTTGYRHGNVFKQCQPIKASHKAVQLISPQSHCSLRLAGLKPPSRSNLWKTVRPPKNVAMVNETERDRGRRKGQTNTLYIPRAREGSLPRC